MLLSYFRLALRGIFRRTEVCYLTDRLKIEAEEWPEIFSLFTERYNYIYYLLTVRYLMFMFPKTENRKFRFPNNF